MGNILKDINHPDLINPFIAQRTKSVGDVEVISIPKIPMDDIKENDEHHTNTSSNNSDIIIEKNNILSNDYHEYIDQVKFEDKPKSSKSKLVFDSEEDFITSVVGYLKELYIDDRLRIINKIKSLI